MNILRFTFMSFRGGMDISKAISKLEFVPTDLSDVLEKSIQWYDQEFAHNFEYRYIDIFNFVRSRVSFSNSNSYREEMLQDIMARLVPKHKRDQLYIAVDRELIKSGIQDPIYKKKRKGEIESFEKFERTTNAVKLEL